MIHGTQYSVRTNLIGLYRGRDVLKCLVVGRSFS